MSGEKFWDFVLGEDHFPAMQWVLRDHGSFDGPVHIQVGELESGGWYVRHQGFGVRRFPDRRAARRAVQAQMRRHEGRWEEVPADPEPFRLLCGADGSRILYDTGDPCLYECWGELKDAIWDELWAAISSGKTLRRTEAHALLGGEIEVTRYVDPKDGVPRFAVVVALDAGGDYRVVDFPDEDAAVHLYEEVVRSKEDRELPYRATDLDEVPYQAPITGRPEVPEGLTALPDGSIISSDEAEEWRYLYGQPRFDWPLTPDAPNPPSPVRAITGEPRDWLPTEAEVRDVTPSAWTEGAGDGEPALRALSLAVLPDGRTVLASGHDDGAHLWNLRDGGIARSFSGHAEWVLDVALAVIGDGSVVLATAGKEGQVRAWSTGDGTVLQEIDDHRRAVNAVAWVCPPRDVPWLISGSDDGTVRVWSVEYARERARFEVGPPGVDVVWSVAGTVLADGQVCVAAASDDSTRSAVHVWDVETETKTHEFVMEHTPTLMVPKVALATLSDGSFRVAAAAGPTVRVWDGLTGDVIRTFPIEETGSAAVALAVLPDLRVAVAAANGPATLVWDTESGAELARVDHGRHGLHHAVELAARPGGGLVLAAAHADDRPARVLRLNPRW
ncbi:WD40 repeat domain-containing protein [Actinomadura terrae]|uniref:WD40 repeat domain-containing protein n=1 Tax=Actinomadura terrae TaxID=604353 RepID=UPI001FA6CC38|nr:hypothetical protein [Actinomadura terrae]